MTITYQNRLSDLWRFSAYTYPRRRAFLILNGLMVIVFSFMLAPTVSKSEGGILLRALVFLTMLVAILAFINLGALLVTVISYVPSRNKGILTTHTLTLDESGVAEETPTGRTDTKWSGIVHVRQNRSFIFLYVSEYGAHVVPKRAFANAADAHRFFQLATDRGRASVTA
jgi:hypothetical protein